MYNGCVEYRVAAVTFLTFVIFLTEIEGIQHADKTGHTGIY
jgi:hypothetical protein